MYRQIRGVDGTGMLYDGYVGRTNIDDDDDADDDNVLVGRVKGETGCWHKPIIETDSTTTNTVQKGGYRQS